MKSLRLARSLACMGLLVSAQGSWASIHDHVHLELDLTGAELRSIVNATVPDAASRTQQAQAQGLESVTRRGERNLDWLARINSERPVASHIVLWDEATLPFYTMDHPREYNAQLILTEASTLQAQCSIYQLQTLDGSADLPTSFSPLTESAYLECARSIDLAYQVAVRWILQQPELDHYTERQFMDVRGIYALEREFDLENKLNHWSALSTDEQSRLTDELVGECQNSQADIDACQLQLERAIHIKGGFLAFYKNYLGESRALRDSFFQIQSQPQVGYWQPSQSNSPATLRIAMNATGSDTLTQEIQSALERRWSTSPEYRLRVDAVPAGAVQNSFELQFVLGAIPQVDHLGGKIIRLDSSQEQFEFPADAVIARQLGHLLGFPDCFVEYYDLDRGVMVSYSIDPEQIMCSRRGHVTPEMWQQLRSKI